MKPHFIVLDPAIQTGELDSFNQLVALSPLPLTYHLPALFGPGTLQREREGIAGILIFGSLASVNSDLPWQKEISQWLLPGLQSGIPTLGICYGHQLMAHLFSGKVETRWTPEKKQRGLREVHLKQNSLWGEAKKGHLFASHGEVVTVCPPSFDVVGTSPLVEIEAMAHNTLPIWTFQCHPEATPSFTARRQAKPEPTGNLAFGHQLIERFFEFAYRNRR